MNGVLCVLSHHFTCSYSKCLQVAGRYVPVAAASFSGRLTLSNGQHYPERLSWPATTGACVQSTRCSHRLHCTLAELRRLVNFQPTRCRPVPQLVHPDTDNTQPGKHDVLARLSGDGGTFGSAHNTLSCTHLQYKLPERRYETH